MLLLRPVNKMKSSNSLLVYGKTDWIQSGVGLSELCFKLCLIENIKLIRFKSNPFNRGDSPQSVDLAVAEILVAGMYTSSTVIKSFPVSVAHQS